MEMAASDTMVDFFLQLLRMTKRMTEDVIPVQLLNLDKTALQELIDASKEAISSLMVFEKLCIIFEKKNLAGLKTKNSTEDHLTTAKKTSVSKPIDNPVGNNATPASAPIPPKELLLWKNVIEKIRTRHENNAKAADMFYCGLCNVHADCADVWGSHLVGKKHKDHGDILLKEQIRSHYCNKCCFFVIAKPDDLDRIIRSPEHLQLDRMLSQKSRPVESSAKDNCAPISKNVRSNDQMVANLAKAPQKSKAPAEVRCNGTVISEQFVNIQSLIKQKISKHQEFTIFFCRPCEAVEYSLDQWKQHVAMSYHVNKMSNRGFQNTRAVCTICRFGMIASKNINISYMMYHVEKCHDVSVKANHIDEYVEIRELAPQKMNRGMSASRSSFKGSCESIGSARYSKQPTPSSGRSTPQEQPVRRESVAKATDNGSTASHPAVQHDSNAIQVEGDGDLALFLKMLDAKEQSIRSDPSYKAFSALCLLCPQLKIVDQFSWFDHVGSHSSNDDQNEVECSECNTFIYGSLQTITEQLIPHPRHCDIDSLMSRL